MGRHQIWPTWPDHTENVTARNTCAPAPTRLTHGTPSGSDSADLVLARRIFHGEGSVINLPVMHLLETEE